MEKRDRRKLMLEIDEEKRSKKKGFGGDLEPEENKPILYLLVVALAAALLLIGLVWTVDIIESQQEKIKKMTKKEEGPKCSQLGYSEGFNHLKPVNPLDTTVRENGELRTKLVNTFDKEITITKVKWDLIRPVQANTSKAKARLIGKSIQEIKENPVAVKPEKTVIIETGKTVNESMSPQLFKGILTLEYTHGTEAKKIQGTEKGILHGCIS